MKRGFFSILGVPFVAALLAVSGCGDGKEPEPPPPATATATQTATRTPTLPPTARPTNTNTPRPTNTPVPTFTQVPSGPTETPTESPTAGAPTESPTPTATSGSGAALCGNSTVEAPETCDDGGLCLGGPSNNQPCASTADCGAGLCRPVGGDGCAKNCTFERIAVFNLGPGSSATAQNPSFGVPIVLSGSLAFRIGEPTGAGGSASDVAGEEFLEGEVPVVQTFAQEEGAGLDPIEVGPGVACACVRGFSARSCGGTADGDDCTTACSGGPLDGQTCENDDQCPGGGTCATRDDVCDGQAACSFIHGPGNTAAGIISCNDTGVIDADYTSTLDSAVSPMESPVETVFSGGPAGRGSAKIGSSSAIGTIVQTTCAFDPGNPNKGEDGMACTDDDPDKGDLNTLTLTTGTATAVLLNANGIPGVNIEPGAICGGTECATQSMGSPIDCSVIEDLVASTPPGGMGTVPAGAAIGSAFPAEGPPPLNDITTPSVFIAQ